MNALLAIVERRSVKHFDPAHVMPDAEIRRLLEHALLSPTSFNMQNWRFVLVRDPSLRREIRAAAWDQAQVTDASLLIVLCADLKAYARNTRRYWRDAPREAADVLVPLMEPFYGAKPQAERDEAMRSTGIAGQTLMLAAKAGGYDSCPMVGFDPERVARLIRLPADHVVSFMIAVGKPLKPAWPRPGQIPYEDVVFDDRFPAVS